jgi:hypothetical protein
MTTIIGKVNLLDILHSLAMSGPVQTFVTVHRGLSRFSRRQGRWVGKVLNCRENGTVPLASLEGDRSMFSANVFLVEYVFPPKNGPVPSQPVNGYKHSLYFADIARSMASNRIPGRSRLRLRNANQRNPPQFSPQFFDKPTKNRRTSPHSHPV